MADQRLITYIDESERGASRDGGFYLMTAAIINQEDPSLNDLRTTMRRFASEQPSRLLHATKLAHKDPATLLKAETAVGQCPAVNLVCAVSNIARGTTFEDARQRCIATLFRHITQNTNARVFILDTRDNLGISAKSKTPKERQNRIDFDTINALVKRKENPNVDVAHGNDKVIHDLWIPDIASYAIATSIMRKDPARLEYIAAQLELMEACVLPVAQRKQVSITAHPPTALSEFLHQTMVEATQKMTALPETDSPVTHSYSLAETIGDIQLISERSRLCLDVDDPPGESELGTPYLSKGDEGIGL
jgi:hypothetical protein